MKRPDFDSIKTYEEFKKYRWTRQDLIDICKEHGLLFIGTEKKLNKVIESYYNGVKIRPRRNWYTNIVLNSFVNENGSLLEIEFCVFIASAIVCMIGVINMIRGTDDAGYVLPLSFGTPFLIFALVGIHSDRPFDIIKSYFPACGDKRFKRAQVDEQANSADARFLSYTKAFLAPDMVIGSSAGVCAVAYEDISSLQIKQLWHREHVGLSGSNRYREYYTYKIIAITHKGKKVALSLTNTRPDGDIKEIYESCLKYDPSVELLEMEKSSEAPDNRPKQVVEGEGVKCAVTKALREQFLIPVTVSEELRKRYIRHHLSLTLSMLPVALVLFAFASVFSRILRMTRRLWRVATPLLICFLMPAYAVYELVLTIVAIKKKDMDFYSGEIIAKTDKGYAIKGIDPYRFGYIKKMKPDQEPAVGDRVILARFRDGFSLVSEKR